MIEVRNLTKKFGKRTVVDDVSLSVREGEAVALWGANGAGKTTVLRCVLGQISFAGTITLAGIDIKRNGRAARRLIGYAPQEISFYDDMRVFEAIKFFARLRRVPVKRCKEQLELVGLPDQNRKRIRALSGGMKQKLAIAISLLSDPPVLILDEPTSSLDGASREDLLSLLCSLRDSGKTILFTSHRSEEMERLANRVLTLESGKLIREHAPKPAQASTCLMTMQLVNGAVTEALAALTAAGFETQQTDSTVTVSIAHNAKAGPIVALQRASIEIIDFNISPLAENTNKGASQ